jgi:NitT/TauT family transport system substrate-binding protein
MWLALLVSAALVHSCSRPAEEAVQSEQPSVRVLVLAYLGYAPFFIGREEGYFQEQGLEVELVKAGSSIPMLPAFVQGDLDVYSGTVNAGLMNAMARGASIRIVAGKGHVGPPGDTYFTLVARRDLIESGRLTDPAGLKGLRISRTTSSTTHFYVDSVLAKAGLSDEDVEFAELPVVARQEALANGAVDLISVGEPWVTRVVRSGLGAVWMPACEVIPDHQFGMMAFSGALLGRNRDAGKRFAVGYLRAVRQYNEGKTARNLAILAAQTGLEQDLLRGMSWPLIRSDGSVNVQSVLDFQDWAVAKGYQDRPVPAEQFWDSSFIEHANAVLGGPAE